ncbi:MAG: DUF4199 domain-containing protein [Chitinophagales bacterium]|nr:DUF4199 domain-containing protein [Chitinophagales bacterium]
MSTLDNPNDHIQPEKVSPWPTGTRYGMIAGLILIAVGLVIHLAGLVDYTNQNSSGNWISNIINAAVMIGAIVMAIKYHRDEELGGHISYGKGFGVGFIVVLLITVLNAVWTFLFFSFIEPDLIHTILDASREQMIEQQGLSEEQADQGLAMMKWMFNPIGMSVWISLFILMSGVFFDLIIAAIMKKSAPQV